MKLHIVPGEGTPIYRQIMNQVKYLIAANRLRPGDEVRITIEGIGTLTNPVIAEAAGSPGGAGPAG